MIEVENICKQIGNQLILDDISFLVPHQQIMGFVGPNGAGKTTTLKIISGCMGADCGSVKLGGHDILLQPRQAKALIGYLPDLPPLYSELSVLEALQFACKIHDISRHKRTQEIEKVLNLLELEDVATRIIGNLSKGFRQRVALAQVLVFGPQIIILDEPTEGLDPVQINSFRKLLLALKKDHTILVSSHILSELEMLCDKLAIIDKGKILFEGSYAKLVEQMDAAMQFEIEFSQNPQTVEKLLGELTMLSGAKVEKKQNRFWANVTFKNFSDDILDTFIMQLINADCKVRQIIRKTMTLEQIFLNITENNTGN